MSERTDPDGTWEMHCPSCLTALESHAHFCPQCGMPISSYATVAPLEHVWAFGWMLNRLLSRPPSRFALLGTWAVAFPVLLVSVPALLAIFVFPGPDWLFTFLAALPTLLIAACYLLLAVRVTVAYVRAPDPDEMTGAAAA